jgi:predicted anti-sigma-YlaC factor YlaD
MDGSGACAGVRSQLGVYLTGAIAPADRATVVRHLNACEDCRAELAGLAGLPGLLRRPAAAQAVAMATEDEDPPYGSAPQPGEARLGRLRRLRRLRRA